MAASSPSPGTVVLGIVALGCVVLSVISMVGSARGGGLLGDYDIEDVGEGWVGSLMSNAEVPWHSIRLDGCTASGRELRIPEGDTCTLRVRGTPEGSVQILALDAGDASYSVSSRVGEGSRLNELKGKSSRRGPLKVAVDEAGVEVRVRCDRGPGDRCVVTVGSAS